MSGESLEIDSELWHAKLAECERLKAESADLLEALEQSGVAREAAEQRCKALEAECNGLTVARDAVRESLTLLERKAWAYLNNREHPEFDTDWVDHLIQRAQSERNARREVEAERDAAQREAAQYRAEHGLLRDDLVAVHRVLMSDTYATFDPVQLPAIVANIMAERDRLKAENAQLRADLAASAVKWERLRARFRALYAADSLDEMREVEVTL